MKKLFFILMSLIAFTVSSASAEEVPPLINTGTLSIVMINAKLESLKDVTSPQARIKSVSSMFLGIPYGAGTLESFDGQQEHLVIDFSSVDCFTFLDYVESLRMSSDFNSFMENLKNVRYKNGEIDFRKRNHFFTDWASAGHVTDVTKQIGGDSVVTVEKELNKKDDTHVYVPGVEIIKRDVEYIPSQAVLDRHLADKLQTGDYVGFYTDKPGLDVSHVGIIIIDKGVIWLRHASSLKTNMKVVNQDFLKYLTRVRGIVVLRPAPAAIRN